MHMGDLLAIIFPVYSQLQVMDILKAMIMGKHGRD
jgi:hypothetical protein